MNDDTSRRWTRRGFVSAGAVALALQASSGLARGSGDQEESFESRKYDLVLTWSEPWQLVDSRTSRRKHLAEVTLENPDVDDLCMVIVTRHDIEEAFDDAEAFLDSFEQDIRKAKQYVSVLDDPRNVKILFSDRQDTWVGSIVTYKSGNDFVLEITEYRVDEDEDFGTGVRFVCAANDDMGDIFREMQRVVELNGDIPLTHLAVA